MTHAIVNRMPWPGRAAPALDPLLAREWLVTNGLGGYASGTVAGVCTRRYHGVLVAALPAPLGRTMLVPHLDEELRLPDGTAVRLSGVERVAREGGALELPGAEVLAEFRLEAALPVWRYEFGGYAVEKRLFMPHMQNTAYVSYRLVAGAGALRLKVRPSVHFRGHDAPVSAAHLGPYEFRAVDHRYELSAGPQLPVLRMKTHGARASFTHDPRATEQVLYRVEASRGYASHGEVWSPGQFRGDLAPGQDVTFVVSTEPWETVLALSPSEAHAAEHQRRARLVATAHPAARAGPAAELVLAADQFIITPAGRVEDAARAHAAGDEVRTVIAGYHWFTDWGRDTMISLEGLTLATGRHLEAGYILRTFAHYVRDGLIPNMFPEGEREGLYHTADATLWFFHAVDRYVKATGDRDTLRQLLPRLEDIVAHHARGTRFGIGVDPDDGLLRQGAEGYQLTWMDAKVEGWVVTPRRGKAVEINALWYNALRLVEAWVREDGRAARADELAAMAARARAAFDRRFWNERAACLYDVVDAEGGGDDAAVRPNQLLAISLEHPVLAREKWAAVFAAVESQLYTPVGLRSLAPGHPDYKPRYDGDLRARDAAYHQGTVWSWLAGPFVDAYLKLHPGDREGARRRIAGLLAHLGEACMGSVSEVFDAEAPYTPRGCVAQAWGVAEVLRAWVKTAG